MDNGKTLSSQNAYILRHGVTQIVEVRFHLRDAATVDDVPSGQHQNLVDRVKNPVTGLVNRQQHGSVALDCHTRQDLHHVESGCAV